MSFDLQVNGYLNIDFSSDQLTEEDFCYSLRKYLEKGADIFLPTVITSSKELYHQNLPMMGKVVEAFGSKVPGLHLEGPFISPKPGAVGAHNPDWTQKPDIEYLKKLQDLANGQVKMITIAAELEGSVELCKAAVEMNIVVSLGHQKASYEDLCRLRDAGAKTLTHLGNGMPRPVDRHDNAIINGLACEGLSAMIITDGHHLPEQVIRCIINAKGMENVIVTSDASPLAGMPPGEYETLGNSVVLEENGKLHNPEKQCLVGSSSTLNDCIQHLKKLGFTQEEIETLSSTNPKKLMCV